MKEIWHKSFITKSQKYALIDGDGDIRATAHKMTGIIKAKEHYKWGKIYRIIFENNNIKLIKLQAKLQTEPKR